MKARGDEDSPSSIVGRESNGVGTIGQNRVGVREESQILEVQDEFEACRTEIDIERVRVRKGLMRVQRQNGQLSGAILAKANARIKHMNSTFLISAFSSFQSM